MLSLETRFKKISRETWNVIKKARSVSYRISEETLTDLFMLIFKYQHSGQIFVKNFNKKEEGINGADWEWWFKSKNKYLGFRVQAKIIECSSDEFKHLHYHSKKPMTYQVDKLIDNARTHNLIPIYCLYLQSDEENFNKNACCLSVEDKNNEELFGCSIISAKEIQRLRPKKNLNDLIDYIFPWHCLLCRKENEDILETMLKFVETNLEIEGKILDKSPSYVSKILNNIDDIEQPDEMLRGLAVFVL